MIRRLNIVVSFCVIFLLQSCASSGVAPVHNRGEVKEPVPKTTQRSSNSETRKTTERSQYKDKKGYHIVNKGDTLYSISWRYNQDYKDLAAWNQIESPYTIYPGQLIRLKSLPEPVAKPARTKKGTPLNTETIQKKKTTTVTAKKSVPAPKSIQKKEQKKTQSIAKSNNNPALPKGPVKWSWPTRGKLARSNSPTSQKGIDITGKTGQTVKAAAFGEVVYSGSGLLGYGKLIIIKHNETYLSAYAYNSKLLVKEGDRVTAGQAISYMGKDHTGRSVLHFEIRKNGKPVNPTKYLPKKSA